MDNQNQQPVDQGGVPQAPVQPEPQVPVVEPVAPVSEPVVPAEPQVPVVEPVAPVSEPVVPAPEPNQGGTPAGTL